MTKWRLPIASNVKLFLEFFQIFSATFQFFLEIESRAHILKFRYSEIHGGRFFLISTDETLLVD